MTYNYITMLGVTNCGREEQSNIMTPKEMLARLGSMMATAMFVWAMFQQYCPHQLRSFVEKYSKRFASFSRPYVQITFNEVSGDRLKRSEAYSAIEAYLGSSAAKQARKLKADAGKNNQTLALSLDDDEEVADEFRGVKLWWASRTHVSESRPFSRYHEAINQNRYYRLTFHRRHRELIQGPYLSHVLKEGKAIEVNRRQRKLYTNTGSWWSHVPFRHRATFQTLAMEAKKKKEIVDDLITFSQAEEFYARIGRAWKRGYLLYGPPGTGKSTMIAAMANLLGYDIYDLELTAVKDNSELRRLLIETSSKSIIVIEDIDCSADFTGQRKKKKEKGEEEDREKDAARKAKEETDSKASKVTLSGLLNFIDGLWTTCGEERLIVFTTNYVEKLDPALIRRGRMDKHIEMSYCSFEAFKVLAKNYLNLESHHLFAKIDGLLDETRVSPAEVAENLMPKTIPGDTEACLHSLIRALETMQEKAKLKADEEAERQESAAKGKAEENGM